MLCVAMGWPNRGHLQLRMRTANVVSSALLLTTVVTGKTLRLVGGGSNAKVGVVLQTAVATKTNTRVITFYLYFVDIFINESEYVKYLSLIFLTTVSTPTHTHIHTHCCSWAACGLQGANACDNDSIL